MCNSMIPQSYKGLAVTGVREGAVENKTNYTEVFIPTSIKVIEEGAFYNCDNLTRVLFEGSEAQWENVQITPDANDNLISATVYFNIVRSFLIDQLSYELSVDGTYYSVVGLGRNSYIEIDIPSTYNDKPVKAIGTEAFYGCSSLTSITIPNSVTSIGYGAFCHCSSLTSVTIGSGVTSIGDFAFYNCTSLTSITFEDTSTWYRTYSESDWQNKTGGAAMDVTTPITNAGYFKSTYYNYYWYKK